MTIRRQITLAVLLTAAAALGLPGCVRVKQVQRERLASPAMDLAVGETGLQGAFRARVVESRTGGGLPGGAPGGGCGCTQ